MQVFNLLWILDIFSVLFFLGHPVLFTDVVIYLYRLLEHEHTILLAEVR